MQGFSCTTMDAVEGRRKRRSVEREGGALVRAKTQPLNSLREGLNKKKKENLLGITNYHTLFIRQI
jgi:hypothetical protein